MSFYTDFPVYPTEILNTTDYPNQVDDVDDVLADLVNALRDEVIAVQAELGTLPKGGYASVKARLDAITVTQATYAVTVVGGTSGSYNVQPAQNTFAYVKIGNLCHVQGTIVIGSANSPVGVVQISLPFTVANLTESADRASASIFLYNHGGTIPNGVWANVEGGGNSFRLQTVSDTGTLKTINASDIDTAWVLLVNFSYITV